jgi:hypothetical protein
MWVVLTNSTVINFPRSAGFEVGRTGRFSYQGGHDLYASHLQKGRPQVLSGAPLRTIQLRGFRSGWRGLLPDLSKAGLGFPGVEALVKGQIIHLQFVLLGTNTDIEGFAYD